MSSVPAAVAYPAVGSPILGPACCSAGSSVSDWRVDDAGTPSAMSDLGLGPDATVTCERCAAQNDRDRRRCRSCGAPLDVSAAAETERSDLELGEAQRALDAEGHDARFDVASDGRVRCPICATLFVPDESVIDELYEACDTPTGRDDVVVLGCALSEV